MIVSTNQPYFSPVSGFFYKAYLSDVFVILDTVQFPRGTTWINRNRIKNDQGTLWLTVPVWKKGLGLQRIDKVRICHEFPWIAKHLASLKTAYARAPFFRDYMPFVEKAYQAGFEKLLDLNLKLIRYFFRQLNIQSEIKLLSDLGIQSTGDQLLIEICKCLGGDTYLSQQATDKYLERNFFQQKGIALRFFKVPVCVYPQLWGRFIPNLSILDLLFNCGPKARQILISK